MVIVINQLDAIASTCSNVVFTQLEFFHSIENWSEFLNPLGRRHARRPIHSQDDPFSEK
jgi:hypothetical protein